jgi:hypothetical protein
MIAVILVLVYDDGLGGVSYQTRTTALQLQFENILNPKERKQHGCTRASQLPNSKTRNAVCRPITRE